MTTTRRTALAMLGLGAATAVGAETFNAAPGKDAVSPIRTCCTAYDRERYAQAFENLARELRRDAVEVQSIDLSAKLEANAIADHHELTVRFFYKPEV